ncbi:hypothetical protein P22_3832 [Propionispora sp. 2/2-37]|uniref:ABC transporter substrate-binding protein n=1 Tax=Propionispora sp. 2/2-37 TaxID=1677858 RepID=UPI0006BB87BD|nr:ABC transporter substrate-binding protein [Propionispora sp. 2/2-37]CUH97697.1 hypothetical protein P22_3832 [Propionispora sp. 2/2-37]
MMAGYKTVRELQETLPSMRCKYCNRLLYRGVVQTIEIKCPKCGMIQLITGCERGWSTPAEALSGGSPRVVTDSAGRMVAIPGRPQRVIALNASNLGLYYAIGGSIIGRVSTNMLPPDMEEKVRGIPTIGLPACLDVERIIEMKPDLVLGMHHLVLRRRHVPMHHTLAAVLEKNGIPVLLQALERYSDVLKTLRLYGELSGNPERAVRKIEDMENRRRELVRQHGAKPSPKVLILWAIADELYTALSHSFVGDLVKRLGGVDMADMVVNIEENSGYTPFSLETVALFRPDVILVVNHGPVPLTENRFYRELAGQPAWQRLDAVRQNAVYPLPHRLLAPGPQVGEALGVLADLLYKGRAS